MFNSEKYSEELLKQKERVKELEAELNMIKGKKKHAFEDISLLDNIPVAICMIDTERNLVDFNEAFSERCKINSRDGAKGKKCREVLAAHAGEICLDCGIDLIMGLKSAAKRIVCAEGCSKGGTPRTGTKRTERVYMNPIIRADGVVAGAVEVIVDITDMVEKEEEMRKMIAGRDKFLSIIAHDLKNPITGFLGLSRILSQEFDDLTLSDIEELSSALHSSSVNLLKLLENLLQWARVQQNNIEYKPEVTDLVYLFERNKALFAQNSAQKGIDVRSSFQNATKAYADSNIVDTIIRNLLSNAIKFTRPGGRVELRVTDDDNPAKVKVEVEDNGIGIDEAMLPRLFQIEELRSTPGTANEHGTGLGLILCRELIEKIGGTISVRSKPGIGTCFAFTLDKIAD